MTPERWQRAENLARAALERPPAERADFLAEGSAGDAELRSKADELLSFYARAEAADTVGLSNGEGAGGPVSTAPFESLAGRVLGRYRVEREIGRGGMGEVYLARDTRLDRPVALKLLPPSLTSDPARVRRFEREARAASSLNHPNIITVYDVGEQAGMHYIVTEVVDGLTLRDWVREERPPLAELADAVRQAALALSAAHRAGIV
ncbi:MAG TPA: protein kinase, partial [Pyrinomonadaceae bacterium]|nr:protein kinase [Pyrinomonadaceae bacterium]